MKKLKTIDGEIVHLLKDRVSEPIGKGAFGQTFYALLSDIKAAHEAYSNSVFVREISSGLNSNSDYYREFGLVPYQSYYRLGCKYFDKATFRIILKAAGVRKQYLP